MHFLLGRLSEVSLDEAVFSMIGDIIETSTGDVIFVEMYNHVVRMITNNKVFVIAGTFGQSGYEGDGQDSTLSQVNQPTALLEVDGGILIADHGNSVIRKLNFICNGVATSDINVCSAHGSL